MKKLIKLDLLPTLACVLLLITAVKTHVIRYCEKVYERSGKKFFWSIKTSGEIINKLKLRGFRETSLLTYDSKYE